MPDLERYKYGELAKRFLKSEEGSIHAGSSLEKLALDLGIADSAEGFIAGAKASEEGIKTTIGVYSEKYDRELNSATVNDLFNFYDSVIRGYLGDTTPEYTRIRTEFQNHSTETFGSIAERIKWAETMIKNGETLGHSDTEIDNAKALVEQYKKLFTAITLLENDRFDKLKSSVTSETYKTALKGLFS